LTQQLRAQLPADLTPEQIFFNLRENHPAPFASFIRRKNDAVVSASPERFFKIQNRIISASPVKGTRPRGTGEEEDSFLRNQLLTSEKDRSENVMIVDLLRNDIGRICNFGSIEVKKLCDLETHPTLFHLVSTVNGELRENINLSDVLKAVFPCGSITGAPKISTMRIIDEIETAPRGLSMGAIGYIGFDKTIDLNVAIRTMVVRESEAIFNVGGGIVIDSVPEQEYEETLVKARALLKAIGASEKNLTH
jgi:para-aminobenzoate synthetase component 1